MASSSIPWKGQSVSRDQLALNRAAGLKHCWVCKQTKPVADFNKSKSRSDGLDPKCRVCQSEWRKANREKLRIAQRPWKVANRDRLNALARKRYDPDKARIYAAKGDPEKRKASGKKWRDAHRDEIKAKVREKRKDPAVRQSRRNEYQQYYAAHREQIAQRNKAYLAANAAKAKAKAQAYRLRNKASYNARTALRAAAKTNATPAWVDRNALLAVYRHAMFLTEQTGCRYDVDHIVPLQSYYVCGLHVPWNLKVSLRDENRRKNNREWPDMGWLVTARHWRMGKPIIER